MNGRPLRFCVPALVRAAALALLTLACCGLSGCTYVMWSDASWWPIAREQYETIDRAVVDAEDVLFVRMARSHGGPQVWAIYLTSAPTHHPGQSVLVADLPAKGTEPVPVVDAATMDAKSAPWVSSGLDRSCLRIGLQDHRYLFISSSPQAMRVELPDPPIAWGSANATGHVLATPFAVVLDVVLIPAYVVLVGLMLTGVVETH